MTEEEQQALQAQVEALIGEVATLRAPDPPATVTPETETANPALDELKAENAAMKAKLDESNGTNVDYWKGEFEKSKAQRQKAKKERDDYKTLLDNKDAEHHAHLNKLTLESALAKEMGAKGVVDKFKHLVMAEMDLSDIVIEDGKVEGLDKKLEKVLETYPEFFASEEAVPPGKKLVATTGGKPTTNLVDSNGNLDWEAAKAKDLARLRKQIAK